MIIVKQHEFHLESNYNLTVINEHFLIIYMGL